MNYLKLQKKILDNWLKYPNTCHSKETKDSYLITDNGYQVFIFPKDELYLDMKKLMKDKTEVKLDDMLKIDGECGYLTGEMKQIDKGTVVKIASENKYAWVDKKLLDRYELKNPHFTVQSERTPLLVHDYDVLVGLILPVRVSE